jgi:hypothetical protein
MELELQTSTLDTVPICMSQVHFLATLLEDMFDSLGGAYDFYNLYSWEVSSNCWVSVQITKKLFL